MRYESVRVGDTLRLTTPDGEPIATIIVGKLRANAVAIGVDADRRQVVIEKDKPRGK